LFNDPGVADDRRRYRQALKDRQQILETRGERASELDAYETLVARHGARLSRSRAQAIELLAEDASPAFRRLAASELSLRIRYSSAGSTDEDAARAELMLRRGTDRRRRVAGYGPHKD